jgi:hypothetical protein
MSDDAPNWTNTNYHKRIAREVAEANEPRNRAQAQLDRWMQSQLDLEAEHRRLMRELNPTGLKIW